MLRVIERYYKAMRRLDAKALLALAHPAYHDRMGTPSPQDDIRYPGLAQILRRRLGMFRVVRIQRVYRKIRWKGLDRAAVELHTTMRMQGGPPNGPPRWLATSDLVLIHLAKHKGKWLITSGM